MQEQKDFNKLIQTQVQFPTDKVLRVDNVADLRKRVQAALQKMTAKDDVEAFITVFERVAEREGLPPDQWVEVLALFLTGDPQKAHFDLNAAEAQQYKKQIALAQQWL